LNIQTDRHTFAFIHTEKIEEEEDYEAIVVYSNVNYNCGISRSLMIKHTTAYVTAKIRIRNKYRNVLINTRR
jgi:hypothetical protein